MSKRQVPGWTDLVTAPHRQAKSSVYRNFNSDLTLVDSVLAGRRWERDFWKMSIRKYAQSNKTKSSV